jgi:hypothetical protein
MGSPGAKSHCSIFVDISPQLFQILSQLQFSKKLSLHHHFVPNLFILPKSEKSLHSEFSDLPVHLGQLLCQAFITKAIATTSAQSTIPRSKTEIRCNSKLRFLKSRDSAHTFSWSDWMHVWRDVLAGGHRWMRGNDEGWRGNDECWRRQTFVHPGSPSIVYIYCRKHVFYHLYMYCR